MRWFATLLPVFAVFFAGGCTEVTEPGGEPVRVTVNPWLAPSGLPGVELCETDNAANCETTDADGKATLRLPVDETSFTGRKEDFGSYLVPLDVPVDGLTHKSDMGSDATLEPLYKDVMSPYPHPDTGRVSIGFGGFVGATMDLFDADGPVEVKRYYFADLGPPPTWSLDPTATTTTFIGGFLEVSPGEYVVQFGGTATNCIPLSGWSGDVPNLVRFPVLADHITQFTVSCEEAP